MRSWQKLICQRQANFSDEFQKHAGIDTAVPWAEQRKQLIVSCDIIASKYRRFQCHGCLSIHQIQFRKHLEVCPT